MAVISPTVKMAKTFADNACYVNWSSIGKPTTDTYEPALTAGFGDKSITFFGAVGAAGFNGATCTLQGCNEETPTNWFTLHDVSSNPIVVTASGMLQIMELPRWIRPSFSVATTGTTPGVSIDLVMRREA